MSVRLRPHHLLCVLTFVGKGYSTAFIENFEEVVKRIVHDREAVEIVNGPDDLCTPLLSDASCHCLSNSAALRDQLAAAALTDLLRQPVQRGVCLSLSSSAFDLLRASFAVAKIRSACAGCQWKSLCDCVARTEFEGTTLLR